MATDPGELLRQARKRKGLTQSELADLASTTQSAISRIEKGGGRGATVKYLEELLGHLDEELVLGTRSKATKSSPKGTTNILYLPLPPLKER